MVTAVGGFQFAGFCLLSRGTTELFVFWSKIRQLPLLFVFSLFAQRA
jgi:hypothetical protein